MDYICTQELIIQINSSLPLLFMLNSCYMTEMVLEVSSCIIPASLLNTMPRNPFCIQPGVSSAPTIPFLHPCPVSSSLQVLHPNAWRKTCTFPPLWGGKYPEVSSFPHWAHWNKWCRCFIHSARGWKPERIFQLCPYIEPISPKHFTTLCIWYERAGSPNDSSLLPLSYIPWLLQFDIYQAADPPADWKIKKWQNDSQTDNTEQLWDR